MGNPQVVAERGFDPWQASAAATHVRAPEASHGGAASRDLSPLGRETASSGRASTSFYGQNFDAPGGSPTWSATTGRDEWRGWSGWNWQDDAASYWPTWRHTSGAPRGSYGGWTASQGDCEATPKRDHDVAWTLGSPIAIRSFNSPVGGPPAAGQPSPSTATFGTTPTGAQPALSVGQGTPAGGTPTLLGANNFDGGGLAMMRTKAGKRPNIAPAGHVRQALEERARDMIQGFFK